MTTLATAAWVGGLSLAGCASTTYNGYPDGTVKYSAIQYRYTAKPALEDPGSKTYALKTNEGARAVTKIAALDERGTRRADGAADVVVDIRAGKITHAPGSFGLGKSFRPALVSKVPLKIVVKDRRGATLAERDLVHEEVLGVPGSKKFATRSEAKAAMASVSGALKSGADKKVRAGVPKTVAKTMKLVAKQLFEPREVKVKLPAIRAAGGLDMEAAYAALAEAEGDAQVKGALGAYARLGTVHKRPDGSPDVLATYGVHCGMAAAKVLVGDLAGAWADTRAAWKAYPRGKEYKMIAKVLKAQQDEAGVEIIPPDEYEAMVNPEGKALQDQLQRLFGKKK